MTQLHKSGNESGRDKGAPSEAQRKEMAIAQASPAQANALQQPRRQSLKRAKM